jgi:hypothetical protein
VLLRQRQQRGADAWYQLSHDLVAFVPVLSEPEPSEGRVADLIQPAPDLDGDGVGDLVFVCHNFVLAVSGKDGKVLWCRQLHANLPLEKEIIYNWKPGQKGSRLVFSHPEAWDKTVPLLSASLARTAPGLTLPIPSRFHKECPTRQAGPPLVVADIDGDGHPDLIFTHGAFLLQVWWEPKTSFQGVARPCVEAVSGRTGKTLWRHEAPNHAERLVLFKKCPHREEILKGDYHYLTPSLVPICEVASLTDRWTEQGRTLLAGLYNEVVRLNLLTGRPLAPPTPLLAEPPEDPKSRKTDWIREPEFLSVAAWSADGQIAVVRKVVPHAQGHSVFNVLQTQSYVEFRGISTIDTRSGQVLYGEAPAAGVLADLSGDGVPNIITGSAVYDGAIGERRWGGGFGEEYGDRRSSGDDGGAALPGPDFDGDGYRDVFSAMVVDGDRFGQPRGVKVLLAGLRSGKDGRPLWLTAQPIPLDGSPRLYFRRIRPRRESLRRDVGGAVFYWQSAPGSAGHFVVNVTKGGWFGTDADEDLAFFFAADTGRLAHVWLFRAKAPVGDAARQHRTC